MNPAVLVVAEPQDGHLSGATREAIGVARSLAGSAVSAVATGTSARTLAGEFGRFGVARVFVAEDPRFDTAPVGAVAHAVRSAAVAANATLVLAGGTTFGRDLLGRLAAAWDATASTGVTDVTVADGVVRVRRPIFGGRATETRRLEGVRVAVALRPHAFAPPAESPTNPTVETLSAVDVPAALWTPRKAGLQPVSSGSGPSLSDAAIVVSGGRGVRAPENFRLVEDLANALGAAVGASRAVTDAGWRPSSFQVGQTGRAVSPQLYIAIGISGAIQHIVGMVSSRVIVAINSDPTAPIFKVADYGIVGDLFQIVPALTAEVRRVRGLG